MTCKTSKSNTSRKPVILVTGGTGYIGSHTVVVLMNAGYQVVIVDNLVNSKEEVLNRLARITRGKIGFYKIDLRKSAALNKVFQKHDISAVIHFAGLKSVEESVREPLRYYDNNINGALSLLRVMERNHVKNIIFSSSASIYGNASHVPIREEAMPAPTNPYAATKRMIEKILLDMHAVDPAWQMVILRYFNPVGAHPSGLIGENPLGIPNNLMPYISQVAVGRRNYINVYGNDYPTPDGTGVRDYIHVMDLAEGHLAALKKMKELSKKNTEQAPIIVNLGTGKGYSVLNMIATFAKASGKEIPHKITGRRPGDVAICYADIRLAKKILKWKATRSLHQMCLDTWKWQSLNPRGY